MATIKLKNGSGAPLASDLVQGEPALDLTNKRLYTEDTLGAVIEVGVNPTELNVTNNITVGGTVDGRDIATDGTKLDGIESGATADQTASEIRTLVDSATDSNVFTDADHTKLDGVEALADVTDTTNVTAAGALMDSELTSEASVKALNQGVATTDSPTFAGLTTTGDVTFGDNDKAQFGAGNDLQIYHDGSNSYIQDSGTGNLRIAGTLLQLNDASFNKYLQGSGDAVTLYNADSPKLTTTSTGIDVTGTVTADSLFSGPSATSGLNFGYISALPTNSSAGSIGWTPASVSGFVNGDLVYVPRTSASANHLFYTGSGTPTKSLRIANNGDISFYDSTGADAKFFWDSSAESLGLNKTSSLGTAKLEIKGAGNTNATNSIFVEDSGAAGVFAVRDNGEVFIKDSLGIGTSSPAHTLQAVDTSAGATTIAVVTDNSGASGTTVAGFGFANAGALKSSITAAVYGNDYMTFNVGGSGTTERMRIDSSGNLLVGGTDTFPGDGDTNTGVSLTASGSAAFSRDGFRVVSVNRNTSDGTLIEFNKGGVEVGSIGTHSGGGTYFYSNSGSDSGLTFWSNVIAPSTSSGGFRDAVTDLGASGGRFKDLYLSGGLRGDTTFKNNAGTTEYARFDSSGNLLVGKTSSGSSTVGFETSSNGQTISTSNGASSLILNRQTSDGTIADFRKDGTTVGSIGVNGSNNLNIGGSVANHAGLEFVDTAYYPQVAQVASDGGVDLGGSSRRFKDLHLSGIIYGVQQTLTRDSGAPLELNRTTNDGELVYFKQGGIVRGSISISGSTTSYNTTSDYRLKENVVAMSGATERLKQLNPSRFNFIGDTDTTVDGFLAHEVADVVPEAITGAKDAVDDEGNAVYQVIDQSKLVPLLVATIQELEARIAALESN